MILSLLHWVVLWVSLSLAGFLFNRLFLKSTKSSFFIYVWIGYAMLTAYLQIASFFLPLNNFWVFVVWILIDCFALFLLTKKIKTLKFTDLKSLIFSNWKYLVFAFITLVLGLYSSTRTVTWYDTYLYHFNMVAWNRDYGVVAGLANFHDRLGFNSSFLVVAAFVERFLNNGFSAFIVNGFLLVTVVLQLGWVLFNKNSHQFVKIFSLLILPYVFFRLTSSETASLSTDLAIVSLSLVLVLAVLEKIDLSYILIIAALIFTIKLSAVMALLLALFLFLSNLKDLKKILLPSILALLILASFFARNIILSGYPLFPSTLFAANVFWRVPASTVQFTSKAVTAWARLPGMDCMSSLTNGFFYWMGPWWQLTKNTWEIKLFALSALLLFVFGKSFFKKNEINLLGIVLFCLASILLMMFLAPDLRFGSIFFWILGAVVLSKIITKLPTKEIYQKNIATLICLFMISFFVVPQFTIDAENHHLFDYDNKISSIELSKTIMSDGTSIFEPSDVNQDRCGNQELLCTHYNYKLKLIEKNNIKKGFVHAD